MELMQYLFDFILHIDVHLGEIIRSYGLWAYAILFVIIFCETGLVVTPFLPGDSLLFAAGTFAATGSLDIWWLCVLLSVAAIAGDTVNYWMGAYVGPRVFSGEKTRFLNREYLVHRSLNSIAINTFCGIIVKIPERRQLCHLPEREVI